MIPHTFIHTNVYSHRKPLRCVLNAIINCDGHIYSLVVYCDKAVEIMYTLCIHFVFCRNTKCIQSVYILYFVETLSKFTRNVIKNDAR
jgi:hypothetical protein